MSRDHFGATIDTLHIDHVRSNGVRKMVTGLVKSAIWSVVEKKRFTSSRSCKLGKQAQDIMDKGSNGESEMNFL